MSLTPPARDGDPRLAAMDEEFRALAAEMILGFRAMSGARKKRVFHPTSTTVAGSLTVLAMPGTPTNAFFEPGRVLPLIIRFANGVQEDDAAWDNRGATLRVLSPERPDRLDRGLLDLLLTTGRTFSSRAARDFRAWMLGDRSAREAMVRAQPRFGLAAWEMFRAIDSYTDVHYFTKVVQSYVDTDGRAFLTRFRLRDPRRAEDTGFLDAGGALLPPDRTSRAPGDERSRTFLHDELRQRVAGEGIDLLLELQVRPVPADPVERDDAVDASRAWSEDAHPWHQAGRIHLHRVVANPQVESLAFNPAHAPRELAMLHARTADDPASLNHLRSLVYEVAAAARLGREPAETLAPSFAPSAAPAPAVPSAPRPRTRPLKVAVIGGGVSGLTAARELTAAGAAVTVFERADEVGGKAASVEIDGHVYDLGAHLCSAAYEQLAALLEELGIARDDVSRVVLYDIEANAPRTTFADVNAEFLRYHARVRPHLAGILEPGFERHEARFSAPLARWAASEGIETLVAATAIGFVASGYGYPSDPELPALYFLKYAETATFCMDPGTLRYWTPRGGFGNVWKRVADELPDVRCGAEIEAVERDADGVRVRAGGVTHRFDRLVVAAPLHEASSWLDLSVDESELFSQIRLLDYATVVVSAEGLPRDGFFLVKKHCEDPGSVGHAVAFHHRYPDADVYLFWAYLDEGMSDEALLGRLGEDAARLGGRLTTVHSVHRWRYFPHVSPAAMDAGFYRRATAMQGRRHTFYAGSLFNFELVDGNMRHARAVARAVMHQDAAAAADTPRPAPAGPSAPAFTTATAPTGIDELVGFLLRVLREETGAGEAVGPDDELRRLGLDSLRSIQLLERVSRELDLVLAPILFFEHPTPRALARHLAGEIERQHRSGARQVAMVPGEGAAASSIPRRQEDVLVYLEGVIREGLNLSSLPMTPDVELPSLGLDSVTSVQIFDRICHDLKLQLAPILFFEHPTLRSLAAHLASEMVRQHGLAGGDEHRAGGRFQPEPTPSTGHAADAPLEARLSRIEDALAGLTAVVQRLAPVSPSSAARPEATSLAGSPAPAGDERALVATASPWILRAPATERPWHRLIAFHPAGGDARTYARWPAHLPAGVELCAVELPGRNAHRARPFTDHAELMAQLVHELWALADVPYSLFGHSFGALLAYEVARRFERRGRGPARLFVSSFAAPAHAQTPHLEHLGGLRISPALWADREVVRSWRHEPDRVHAPIAIFHGQDDPVFGRDAVERWAEATTGRTVLHVNAGGHFHLLDGALVPGLVGAHLLADRSPGPTAREEDAVEVPHPEPTAEATAAAGEAVLHALDRQFGDRCVTSGTWNLYDLAWIARAHAEPEGRGGPAFPEALRVLLSRLEPDGSFGALASPLPQSTLLISLVAANTLLQWNGLEGRDFGPLIEALLDQAERASERLKDRRYLGLDPPYGRLYRFPGLLGQSLIPSSECALLLREGRFLAPARQQWLRSHVRDAEVALGEEHFTRGSWLIGFGEYFPAEIVRSPAARNHAESVAPALPAHSAAFAARYFDETRSAQVRASLAAALTHPETGLRPNGRLQEVYFALHYLAKTGLDLTRLCPGMIRYFQSTQRTYGVAIDDGGLTVDVDSTAIALYLSERLGLDVPIERGARILDSQWDEARECYGNTLGTFPNVNISVMVLRAYLEMRSVPWERKREIWRRTIRQLESRNWMVLEHLSPFYAWEGIISVFFEHEHLFPDDPTAVHHEALAELLRQQTPSGGFHSFYLAEPSLEESGYALLALKAAARGSLAAGRRREVMAALGRAQAFLEQPWCDARRSGQSLLHPELWIGKTTFTSVNLVDAVIAAALLTPPASARLVLDGGTAADGATDRGTGRGEDFGRLYRLATLLRPGALAESLRNVDQHMEARTIRRGGEVSPLRACQCGGAATLPTTYVYDGRSSSIEAFLERTGTTGLIVLRGDTILFERYYQGTTAASRTLGWSVSKSVVSALIGVAVGEGLIRDIREPVSAYVPTLVGSGFDGVSIKDVLQMSSGVEVDKDEGDGDAMTKLRMIPALLTNRPIDDVVAALAPERQPGTYFRYHAANTQVLAMVLRAATGRSLAQYAEEKLWGPVGMEADASWLVDGAGIELAPIGLSAVLRDQARFGLLYLRAGRAGDRQILPEQWVRDSVTADAAHLVPGKNGLSDWVEGYGYHWWIPQEPDGDFFAMGAYGQAIYVSPRHDIVIARSAAYEDYGTDADRVELEATDVYKAISRNIG